MAGNTISKSIGPDLGSGKWKYRAAVIGEDGHVYCPPDHAKQVLRILADTGAVEEIGPDLGSGGGKYFAVVIGQDGHVYCPPYNAKRALRIRADTGAVEEIGPELPSGIWKYYAAVIGQDGYVYCPPCNAKQVLCIRADTGAVDEIGPDLGSGFDKYLAAAIGQDGHVYCPPCNAKRVLRIRADTGAVEEIGPELGGGGDKYHAAVMGQDGHVYCPPCNAKRVLRIRADTGAVEEIGPELPSGIWKYFAAVIGQDGYMYCPPCNAKRMLRIRADTGAVDEIGPDLGSGGDKYHAAVMGQDGHVYCPPCNAKRMLRIRADTGAVEEIGPDLGSGEWKHLAAVMGQHGYVYCPPGDAKRVLQINTSATFGTSRALVAYDDPGNAAPADRAAFFAMARRFIDLFVAHANASLQSQSATSFADTLESQVGDEREVKILAAKYWTSAEAYPGSTRPFYSMVQEVYRRQADTAIPPELLDEHAKFCRSIGQYLVDPRSDMGTVAWPCPELPDNARKALQGWGATVHSAMRTFRGTWMPSEKVAFYVQQHKKNATFTYAYYRAPMFLATSSSLRVAERALRWTTVRPPDHVPVIFVVHIGSWKTCQVNFLGGISLLPGESEWLYQAYSTFGVYKIAARPQAPTVANPVVIELEAHYDNKEADLTLPLAEWI